jgi:thiamine pyrophosphokinase
MQTDSLQCKPTPFNGKGVFFMRAVVFANGVIRETHLVKNLLTEKDFIVSADGGLGYIRSLNLIPQLVVGDFDSINGDDIEFLNNYDVEILKFPTDKDQTDLEIALRELVKRDYKDILVIGALGGRIDQTLANFGLISTISNDDVRIEFDDGQEHIMLIRNSQLFYGKKGDTVSLIPLCSPAKGILTNESLLPDQTRGISNMMMGEIAEINITSGTVLCIHTRIKDGQEGGKNG